MPIALAPDTFIVLIFCSIQNEISLTSPQHLAGIWKRSRLVRQRGPVLVKLLCGSAPHDEKRPPGLSEHRGRVVCVRRNMLF